MSLKSAAIRILSSLMRPGISSLCAAAVLCPLLRAAGPRRAVAERNIRRAMPDAPDDEVRRLVRATYDHIIWTGIEFLALQRDPRQVLDWVEAEGTEILDSVRDDGAILLTGHVGNWELAAAWVAQSGIDITAIVRESSDEGERRAIDGMREHVGVHVLSKAASMKRAVDVLRRGSCLGILPDQFEGSSGIKVPFLGIETSTARGPAVFALLTRRPLIPIFSHRVAPFRHKLRIAPPIEWSERETRDETIYEITRKVNDVMGEMVREAPGQWLAAHRRFRELESA